MLSVGLILLLSPIYLVRTQTDFQAYEGLVFVNEGDSVNITCIFQSEMAMHFTWYQHKFGQKPKLIINFYKYDQKFTFHNEFKHQARFRMVRENDRAHLEIKDLQLSDSATYYCGSAHSNIVHFANGTDLVVQGSQLHRISVLQHPVSQTLNPGASATLHCTVITNHRTEEHTVYWFKHNSRESHPGIIYTYGDSSNWCKTKANAESQTQTCLYSLPKTNLSPDDTGTYYCAVAVCGEVLFGQGTQLDIHFTDVGCSDHIHTLVVFSIVRTFVLFCCVVVIMMYFCWGKKKKVVTKKKQDFNR